MTNALSPDMVRVIRDFWTFSVFLLHVEDGQLGPTDNFAAGYTSRAAQDGL